MIKKLLIGVIGVLLLIGCGNNSEITGQGFLMTKGGLARTCAGNIVYLEKANIRGYTVVHDKIAVLKDKLDDNKNSLDFYYDKHMPSLKESIDKYGSSTKFAELLEEAKKRVDELEEDSAVLEDELEPLEFEIEHLSKSDVKETTCDSQGNFAFHELEQEKYYISTKVEWFVGKEKQGGIVSKTIVIKDGKNKIILTEK